VTPPGGTTNPGNVFVPKTPEVFSHDLDGNLTGDGRWTYTWDGENRLKTVETTSAAAAVGVPKLRLNFRYNAEGQRVEKKVETWNGSAYVMTTELKFLYDHRWHLLAELSDQSLGAPAPLGPEPQRHLRRCRRGGWPSGHGRTDRDVAFLRRQRDGMTDYYGDEVARYEYGAFGEPLRARERWQRPIRSSFRPITRMSKPGSSMPSNAITCQLRGGGYRGIPLVNAEA
jgi:hypothetical protein